jgi:hypothetical protein
MQISFGLQAVPWFRQFVAGLSPRRTGLDHNSVYVGFVVEKVVVQKVILRVFGFPPVSIISLLHDKSACCSY